MPHDRRRSRSTTGCRPPRPVGAAGAAFALVAGLLAAPGTASAVPATPDVTLTGTVHTGGAATLAAGDPVAYDVATSIGDSAPGGRLTLTVSTPSGVRALGAAGTGWACRPARLQAVSCVSAAVPGPGSTLGAVTVTAVATAAQPTATAADVTVAATDGAATFTASGPAASGTNPAAPTVTAVEPAVGPRSGQTPLTVSGTGLSAATAVVVGTPAQLAAGTAATLVRCTAVAAPQCFTEKDGTLSISSLPSGGGDVTVRVLAKGVSASGAYRYADIPDAPIATATPVTGGAQVTWTAPAAGSSPVTGYTVTALKGDTAVVADTRTTPPSASSVQFDGLDVGTAYRFQVRANSAAGDSQPGTTFVAVPFAPPSAPLHPSISPGPIARTLQLNWTQPVDDGGAYVSKYRVTPIRDGVTQTPVDASPDATGSLNGFRLNGVVEGHAYAFTVAAVTAAGQGPASAAAPAVKVPDLSASQALPPTVTAPTSVVGDVGRPLPWASAVSGGFSPRNWSVISGSLPTGLSLNASSGQLTGKPSAAGTFTPKVQVKDGKGRTDTVQTTMVVRPTVALTTTSSGSSFTGEPTTLSTSVTDFVSATPVTDGIVRYYDTSPGRNAVALGTVAVQNGQAATTVTLPAGDHTVTAIYFKDDSVGSLRSSTSLQVTDRPGSVLITAFGTSGTAATSGWYAELTNVTAAPVSLAPLSLQEASGEAVPLPEVILASGRSFLMAGPDFVAPVGTAADLTAEGNWGVGQLLLKQGSVIIDAAGPDKWPTGQVGPLPDLRQSTVEYSWIRPRPSGGYRNTGDNTVDFALVTEDGAAVGGVTAMAGSASPQGTTSPWFRAGQLDSALLNPQVSESAAPNRTITKQSGQPGGTIVTRRVITNRSTQTLDRVTLRLIDLSQANGLPGLTTSPTATTAALRAVAPATGTASFTVAGQPVTVQQLTPSGRGLNALYDVPLPDGRLAPGASVAVSLTFQADTGGQFRFRYLAEGHPAT